MGFSAGIYVGTVYDCKPTVEFISKCIKNNIPKDAIPKKKDERNSFKNKKTFPKSSITKYEETCK